LSDSYYARLYSGIREFLRLEAAAGILVSECPFCLKMFEDGLASGRGGGTLRVRDVAELVAESLGAAP